jgi:hypothetical protein
MKSRRKTLRLEHSLVALERATALGSADGFRKANFTYFAAETLLTSMASPLAVPVTLA